MSVSDKNVAICTCNATMPLDRDALARATGVADLHVHTAMCQQGAGEFAKRASRRHGRCMHAGATPAGRPRGRSGRRAIHSLRQYPRDGRMVGRSVACHAQDRSAARGCRAAGPRARGVGRIQVGRTIADRRPARSGIEVGRCARAGVVRHRAVDAVLVRNGFAGNAQLPRRFRPTDAARWLAGRVRRAVDAGKPDRPRCLHTLQRLRERLPRACDHVEFPGRSRSLQGPSCLRDRLRRRRCDRLRPPRHDAWRSLRRGARPAADTVVHAAPAATRLFRAR